jgi:ribonuclease HII
LLKISYTPDLVEAGVDEAGRGCLAGPVVAAAVILNKELGLPTVNDSKQLKETERLKLETLIKENALAYSIQEVDNLIIDQINILNASILAMHLSLDQLKVRPELILVDGNKFKPYQFIPYQCIVKGDAKYQSIAKCHRDRIMDEWHTYYPAYGWKNNKGYPTRQHCKTIAEIGYSPIHRLTFKSEIW